MATFSAPERMDFPGEERATQARWEEMDAFQTSMKQSKEAGRPVFTFTTDLRLPQVFRTTVTFLQAPSRIL